MAKEIDLDNALQNMGAQMVKEVASETSDAAGDGTTTATVLAQAIYREGSRNVTAGADPMAIKRGIEKSVTAITAELVRISKPVSGSMIAQVGTISANHDEAIGLIIAARWTGSARWRHRRRGGKTLETRSSGGGLQFDRGYCRRTSARRRGMTASRTAFILIHERSSA